MLFRNKLQGKDDVDSLNRSLYESSTWLWEAAVVAVVVIPFQGLVANCIHTISLDSHSKILEF